MEMEEKEGIGKTKFYFVQHPVGKNKENDVGGKSINGFKMPKGEVFRINDYGNDFVSNTLDWNGKEPSQGKARVVKQMMKRKQQHRKAKKNN